ncbi:unnamed protein product [Lota lota]
MNLRRVPHRPVRVEVSRQPCLAVEMAQRRRGGGAPLPQMKWNQERAGNPNFQHSPTYRQIKAWLKRWKDGGRTRGGGPSMETACSQSALGRSTKLGSDKRKGEFDGGVGGGCPGSWKARHASDPDVQMRSRQRLQAETDCDSTR